MATRNTIQQRIVEQHLLHLGNHPTAEQVYESVHENYPHVGKATVYRVLNRLCEDGKAQRVRINNGPDCFDHKTMPHFHVRCIRCGKVDDVFFPEEMSLDMAAEDQTGYEISGHTIQFDGICPECRQFL